MVLSYEDLAQKRKNCTRCCLSAPNDTSPRLLNCKCTGNELLDSDVVSHWSLLLGSRNPEIVVVGQDFECWTNFKSFTRNHWYKKPVSELDETTRMLLRLLLTALCGESKDVLNEQDTDTLKNKVYLTNSILCFKHKGEVNASNPMSSANLRSSWINACAVEFLDPLLAILKPRVVIGLGRQGWRAVSSVLNLPACKTLSDCIGRPFPFGHRQFATPVFHTSALARTRRPESLQKKDWLRIYELIREERSLHP